MPSATPDADPKLLVMSLRTMPDSVSTFGPFDPSPGYGPPVSSGIASTSVAELDAEDEAEGVLEVPADVPPLDGLVEPPELLSSAAHPATTARPAPARRRRTFLRRRVPRSWTRPRSCSCGVISVSSVGCL